MSSKGDNAFIYISKTTMSSKGDNVFIYISKMTMSSKGGNAFIYILKTTMSAIMPSFAFQRRQCLHLYFEDDTVFKRRQCLHLHFEDDNVFTSGKEGSKDDVVMVDLVEAKRLAAKQMKKIKAKEKFMRRCQIEACNGAWAMIGFTTGLVIEGQTGKSILTQRLERTEIEEEAILKSMG
ncbi:hypothetical protein JHK87_044671 [Glycine soja]|nr:hypothetical protein JHK87_044671 [Glycine soja]